ncbi:hypothetical protein JP74_21195 [Devosia sp. 17-2-E-8]|nr:hypothetical protein JP74_21195 [Devosia sp. 17-2-E-8]
MGKAARAKADQRQAWISSLSEDENYAREAAENLLRRFLIPSEATGMCYRMTFLLHLYLAEKGVDTIPVVGWITDSRDDISISHAWLTVNGKKIDLTLGRVSHESMLVGEVIILDHVVSPGALHTCFLDKEEKHLAADAILSSQPTSRTLLEHKNLEHVEMTDRAADPDAMRKYLDSAPDGWTYERLKAVIEGRDPRSV